MMKGKGLVAKILKHVSKDCWHIRCNGFERRVSRDASEAQSLRFGAHEKCYLDAVVIRNDVLNFVSNTADNTGIVGVVSRTVDLDEVTSDGSG